MSTSNRSPQSVPPGLPSSPSAAVVPAPLKWSFPFEAKDGNVADPYTWLKALSNTHSGFYPLGANGMWHGGIHFDEATGSALKQLDGVRAIADGEVVAYRLDTTYPEVRYSDRRMALYSTGFVLIRHKLVLPPGPTQSKLSASSHDPASVRASPPVPSSAPAALDHAPPADDVLEFYSLYMHQLDWAGYQAGERGAGNKPVGADAALTRRMPYWKGDRRFIVGAKGTAMQKVPPSSNVAFRFDHASNRSGDDAEAISTKILSDGLGNVVELGSSTVSKAAPYLERVRMSAPPVDQAELNTQQPAQGVQIRDRAKGTVIGLLPRGGEITVAGDLTSGWAQIASIVKGAPVARGVNDQPDPRATTGWVRLDEFDMVIDPWPLDTVVVLDQPFAVKAGDVVGYVGEYQDYSDSQLLPPKPSCPLLHVEVFAGESFKRFVERSRDRAKVLRRTQESLLLIHEGARLVAPADSDQAIPAGQLLQLAGSDPGRGRWAKVQPMLVPAAPAQRTTRSHQPQRNRPAGPEVWIERELSGKTSSVPVEAWSTFPLQLSNARAASAVYQQVISRASLERIPNGSARDDSGVQWWNVSVGDATGRTSWGWICDKDHPRTEWQSPWSWPGFELVDSSSIPPANMFKRFVFVTDQLFDGEAQEFSTVAASISKGELIGKLGRLVDLQGDGDGKVTAKALREALKTRWLAGALSQVAVRYESEWGGGMAKWDALSSLMGDGRYIWQGELERIQKLQWWEKVAGALKGFPAAPVVWHLHPVGVVGNFFHHSDISMDCYEFQTTEGIFRVSKRALQLILSSEGYRPKPYVPSGDQSSGVTVGYGYDLGQQSVNIIQSDLNGIFSSEHIQRLASASGRRGDVARAHVRSLGDIEISLDMAMRLAVVMKRRYAQQTVDAFPTVTSLHPHCQGALLSLVINRGPGMQDTPGKLTREHMRNIREDIAAHNLLDVSTQLRNMKALWNARRQNGLIIRREEEAILFSDGVSESKGGTK